MTQFNLDNFNVISLQKRGESEMQMNKRYITFTKALLEEMGWPPYVRVLINAKDKVLALQVCKVTDENAYKFTQPKEKQRKGKYCSSIPIRNSVTATMGDSYEDDKFYGFKGTYYPEVKAMVFNLNEAYLRHPTRK